MWSDSAYDAASAIIQSQLFEVWQIDAVIGLSDGPFGPFDLAVVAETAIVDGDQVHSLHVIDREDGTDGVVYSQDLTGVVCSLMLWG